MSNKNSMLPGPQAFRQRSQAFVPLFLTRKYYPHQTSNNLSNSRCVVHVTDGVVRVTDGVVRKTDGVVRKTDYVVRKTDGVVRKPDYVVRKTDGVVRKPDYVVRKTDGVVGKTDGVVRKTDGVVRMVWTVKRMPAPLRTPFLIVSFNNPFCSY